MSEELEPAATEEHDQKKEKPVASEGFIETPKLNDVLPRAELLDRFGADLILEEYGKADIKTIAKKNPSILHHVAANVWNRIINRAWHQVNPLQFATYFRSGNPHLHLAISETLGIELIRDIYFVKGWKGTKKKRNLAVEMLVAWVYRNDLQLTDVTFIDPDNPIPVKERRFALQTHQGLGLLPTLMGNLQNKAEELHCEQLTLTAGMRDQVGLFSQYGFVVEDSEMGRRGMKIGFGIPMERDVQ